MAEFVDYEVKLGTFEKNKDYQWKTLKKFNDYDKAYRFFHDYANKQMGYTDEELKKIWASGRIDLKITRANKTLNWVAVYSHRVSKELDGEDIEYESEEEFNEKADD